MVQLVLHGSNRGTHLHFNAPETQIFLRTLNKVFSNADGTRNRSGSAWRMGTLLTCDALERLHEALAVELEELE